MKKLLTILCIVISFRSGAAPTDNILGNFYVTNLPTKVLLCDYLSAVTPSIYTDPATGQPVLKIAKEDIKFTVVGFVTYNGTSSYAVIRIWNYGTDSDKKRQGIPPPPMLKRIKDFSKQAAENPFIDASADDLYFAISMEDLSTRCSPYHGKGAKFSYGIVTMPYKMRFGNGAEKYFQFSSNYNIGGTAGLRFAIPSRSMQSISVLGGISLSSFEVDSASTHGYQQNKLTAAALTPLAGVIYEYERYQVGVLLGWDILPGQLGRKWLYQGNTFMAVGIGVALFQPNKAEEDSDANKNK